MTDLATAQPAAPATPATPATPAISGADAGGTWALRRRQLAAVIRLELRKGYRGRGIIGLLILAMAPPAVFALRLMVPAALPDPTNLGEATMLMAYAFDFILRSVVFLGCVLIFGNLIRREVLDRSLHFYFLAPLRRELLVVAKYLTGILVSFAAFGASTLATFALIYWPYDSHLRNDFLLHGPGLANLGWYLLVTALACAGYGAVFLTLGFFFRSPALPALAFLGWETIHFLLPPALKLLSVIHYLQALCPVAIPQGPFAVLSDAPSHATAIGGLLLLTVLLVAISAWRIRRMEIAYLDD
jgi:ABC-type transport system involved in multi-copper enzyme maturation permease subunit